MGILGGTLTSLLHLVTADDLLRTLVLAAAGATVSFLVSWLLKRIISRGKRKSKA